MANKLELALDHSLEQLANGSSLEECLAQYPELREDLAPLLIAAQKTAALAQVKASPEFRNRGRTQLLAHMRANPRRRSTNWSGNSLRYAAMAAVVVLALATTGTALAQNALPGDSLYDWKLNSEQIWRAFQEDKLGADQAIAQRRLSELAVVQDDDLRKMQSAQLYTQAVEVVRQSVVDHPEQVENVNEFLSAQQGTVLSVITDIPNTLPNLEGLLSIISSATDIPLLPEMNTESDSPESTQPPPGGSAASAEKQPTALADQPAPQAEAPAEREDEGPLQGLKDLIQDTIDLLPHLP